MWKLNATAGWRKIMRLFCICLKCEQMFYLQTPWAVTDGQPTCGTSVLVDVLCSLDATRGQMLSCRQCAEFSSSLTERKLAHSSCHDCRLPEEAWYVAARFVTVLPLSHQQRRKIFPDCWVNLTEVSLNRVPVVKTWSWEWFIAFLHS